MNSLPSQRALIRFRPWLLTSQVRLTYKACNETKHESFVMEGGGTVVAQTGHEPRKCEERANARKLCVGISARLNFELFTILCESTLGREVLNITSIYSK